MPPMLAVLPVETALPMPCSCPPACRDSFARNVQTHRPTAKAQVEKLEKVRLVVGVCPSVSIG